MEQASYQPSRFCNFEVVPELLEDCTPQYFGINRLLTHLFYCYESHVFRCNSTFGSLHFLSLTTADWLCIFMYCKYHSFGESFIP